MNELYEDDYELNLEFLRKEGYNDQMIDVLIFLEELRRSGVTNMFNSLPYMKKEFDEFTEEELKNILTFYFKNYKKIYIKEGE